MGKGWLTDDEVQDLKEWTFELNVEDDRLLTRFDWRIQLIFFFQTLANLVLDIWREWKWVKDGKNALLIFGELKTSKFTTLIIHSQKELF